NLCSLKDMKKKWLYTCFFMALCLLGVIENYHTRFLQPYFIREKTLTLSHFENAKRKVRNEDLQNLKLWESILTGRSNSISKLMKEKYRKLALNHIFTPSGFHLSAVLFPFLRFIPRNRHQVLLLF